MDSWGLIPSFITYKLISTSQFLLLSLPFRPPYLFFVVFVGSMLACGISVPQPGIETVSPALESGVLASGWLDSLVLNSFFTEFV